jgi:galactokinase
VLHENDRVIQAVTALRAREPELLGELMNASHRSLRDLYQVSTPAVEATVERLLKAGASGARLVGGGFGGSVLALLAPGVRTPPGAFEVSPGPGAHLIT